MPQTVYIDKKTVRLSSEKKQLILHNDTGQRTSLPFRMIERLVIYGHCQIDTYLLSKLSEHNITTILLTSTHSSNAAIISGKQHQDARIQINQYQIYQDRNLCLYASKKLVKTKLLRQYRIIRKIQPLYPQFQKSSHDSCQRISRLIESIASCGSQKKLLGIEGSAAKQYFGALKNFFPSALGFEKRQTRPATDPVNALLSLSYTIFASRCTQALIGVGLNPHIGFFHKINYGRHSLALDMMEPWRPKLDYLVWTLLKKAIIKKTMFSYQGNSCVLNKKGRTRFYPVFEHEMKSWQKTLNRTARFFAKNTKNRIPRSASEPFQYDLF